MNNDITKIITKLILPDHTIHIKLLGDSVTHGAGGSGYQQDGELIIEESAPRTGRWFRNTKGYCWANLFRDHMESQYDCKVINNACSGIGIEFILDNFHELVSEDDDIVLCAIGHNNRAQHISAGQKHTKREHMELFYRNILALHTKFREAGKDVIFIANVPTPASDENKPDGNGDVWRIFRMNDVHDLHLKASVECGFPMISLYEAVMEYCEEHNITVDSLIADGLHPNDEGYRVMFRLLMRKLGLALQVE